MVQSPKEAMWSPVHRTDVGAKSWKFLELASVALVTVLAIMVFQGILHNAAEHVNGEATEQGFKLLAEAMDLVSSLQQAKEDNDLLARKVHRERSRIFAELREMQQSVVEILHGVDKMTQSVENSLVALKKDMEVETQETELYRPDNRHLDLENAAYKVTEKSENLKREAEENIKLRKFLEGADLSINTLRLLFWFSNEVQKDMPVHLYSELLHHTIAVAAAPAAETTFASVTKPVLGFFFRRSHMMQSDS